MEKIKLPKDYEKQMQELLGENYQKYIDSFSDGYYKAIQLNTLKLNENDLRKVLPIEKIPYNPNGFYVKDTYKEPLGNTFLYLGGGIYIQEPFAMIPAIALDVRKGDIVLDVCSAPGGKTSELAIALEGEGLLVSNEIVSSRASILYENISRLGFKNVVITNTDSETLSKNLPAVFDKVLVDAPCSGEGMFRKNPKAMNEWSLEQVSSCAERQLEILNNSAKCLKAGGKLVYSTCTFNLEEDEKVVENFLNENKDFELLDLPNVIKNEGFAGNYKCDYDMQKTCKFYPFKSVGEGQFVALFKKIGEEDFNEDFNLRKSCFKPLESKEKSIILKDLEKILEIDINSLNIVKRNINIYFLSKNMVNLDKIKPLCAGVLVGEFVKNRLDYSHFFYSSFGKYFKNVVKLTDENFNNYLKGYEIETDNENGICAVEYNGLILGGGKVVNGKVKNYFPKNLRLK